ncbi:MAG: PA2778 family cysteine peptidase, partial [Geminicoccaceae bacterium]
MTIERLAACMIMAGLVACSHPGGPGPDIDATGLLPAVSLASVPFHPQAERSDCGPAALAMMFGSTGLDTTPGALAPAVFTPGRDGTLQSDIVQTSRRAGRLTVPVHGFRNVLAELDAGNPVLVLQNLGLERWPLWHYAVAVGYDLESATLFLHSGKTARLATSFSDFEKSWQSSERWALTITRPNQLSATLDQGEGLEAANGLEQAGQADAATAAYGALLERWPDSLAALMGFGNARYAAGDVETAGKTFRHAVALHPKAAEAWNNLAVSLAEMGRLEDALDAAREAVRLGGPNKAAAEQTLAEL